jgi:hypothetical protein
VLERDRGNVGVAELLAGENAAVAGDHFAAGVDQYRYIEPERVDAARDLADLPGAVHAWVPGIELELGDRAIDHLNSSRGFIDILHSP